MRLTALTVGSRGDAQPYLALAGAAAGWPPGDLATPARSSPTPAAWGLGFAPTEGNPRQMLETEQGDAWLEAGRHPLRGTRRLLAVARPLAARLLADATAACQDAEAIIYARGGLAAPRSPSATASRRCWPRCCRSASPGRSRPRARPPGGWVAPMTLLSHLVAEQFGWQPFRGLINQWRRHTLGLPPAPLLGPDRTPRRRRAPVLYGYSRWVVPKPPDWGQHLHVTG